MSCIYKYKGKDYTKDEFYSLVRTTMVQPKTVEKYNKILFPTGNTASKIEGHTTLEEFKKQREDTILRNEKRLNSYSIQPFNNKGFKVFVGTVPQFDTFKTKEEAEQKIKEMSADDIREINQLKQELERVETEGFAALKPIYNFYENIVTNILKKQGYSPKVITDEYDNTWNEITLNNARDLNPIQFQILTAEEKARTIEQVTKEHRSITALKDLAAKLAHRIGGKIEFVNKTDVDWKAYNQDMKSVLNEAYMTPDTPFHEILAHPIIRAIKNRKQINDKKIKEIQNMIDYPLKREDGYSFYDLGYEINTNNLEEYRKELNKIIQSLKVEQSTIPNLYQSLLKELETGRGKEVFEQVKRDYKYKERKFTNHYIGDGFTTEDTPGETTPFSLEEFKKLPEGVVEKVEKNEYLDITTETINIDGVIYEHTFGEDTTEKVTKRELPKYSLEEQQEEAIVQIIGLYSAQKLDKLKDKTLIQLIKELLKEMSDFVKLIFKKEINIAKDLDNISELTDTELNKLLRNGEITKKC